MGVSLCPTLAYPEHVREATLWTPWVLSQPYVRPPQDNGKQLKEFDYTELGKECL